MLFWLSFCNAKRPKGEQFLGVALVEGEGPDPKEQLKDAIRRAWASGCNPGGQIQSTLLSDELLDRMPATNRLRLAQAPRNTLLDRDELAHYDLI